MENPTYPFLKLTLDERFPRLLVTRQPNNKLPDQNIYGAFLPTGMVRRLFDLLARIFRLHPCELDIKGDFDAPCPEYFLHRCLAPCVERICDRETYMEAVEMVHLILSNQGESALNKIDRKIERLADALEYESAAEWRDARFSIEEILRNAKWQIDVSMMNDVITITDEKDSARLHLTTLRRGKAVGKLDFQLKKDSVDKILFGFISKFYRYYAPKQIYVPEDFPNRKFLEKKLSTDFGRRIKIIAQREDKLPPSIFETHKLAPRVFRYRSQKSSSSETKDLLAELKRIFGLRKMPRRIECFDVAHLAGKEIIAARVVAINGVLQQEDGLVWEFENLSETSALAAAVRERLRLIPNEKDLPELILLDGGRPQINAVRTILGEFNRLNLKTIGAVKPPKSHNQISHFLIDDLPIKFDKRSKAMNFLQNLRDASHTLANETHRQLHSLVQIFKNNEGAPLVKYLLVPTRYAERGGDAEDLSPIRSLTQAGEVILKTKKKSSKTV